MRLVYGTAPPVRLSLWDWEEIDVVWFHRLPEVLRRQCYMLGTNGTLRKGTSWVEYVYALPGLGCRGCPNFAKSFHTTGLLWRLRPADNCAGFEVHKGGNPLRIELERDAGWVEVSHVQEHSSVDQRHYGDPGMFWMMRARGSGLWYRQGTLQTRDDTYFHDAVFDENGSYLSPPARNWSTGFRGAFDWLRGQGVDTVYYERRNGDMKYTMDAHTHRCGNLNSSALLPFFNHEYVGLRVTNCSDSHSVKQACVNAICMPGKVDSLRWGWPDLPVHAVCPRPCSLRKMKAWECDFQ